MRQFAAMPTPTIMVENKAARHATSSVLSKKAKVRTAMKQRMRLAAAQ